MQPLCRAKTHWRLHHYDVVSNLCDEIEIVERDDNRTSGIGERTKPATGVEDMAGIEAGSWLIDDEHLRRADGGAGKHDPGKFTARQLRCGTIAQVEQIEAESAVSIFGCHAFGRSPNAGKCAVRPKATTRSTLMGQSTRGAWGK